MKQKLAEETDPKKKAEIQKDITIAEAEQQYDNTVKKIEETGAGAASSETSNSALSTGSPYNSSASQASTGAGQMASSDANNRMYSATGGRRRSRRYKRK